jgi:hypothetical protein
MRRHERSWEVNAVETILDEIEQILEGLEPEDLEVPDCAVPETETVGYSCWALIGLT